MIELALTLPDTPGVRNALWALRCELLAAAWVKATEGERAVIEAAADYLKPYSARPGKGTEQ